MLGINLYELEPFWKDWGIPIEVIFFAKTIIIGLLVTAGVFLKRIYDRYRAETGRVERPASAGRVVRPRENSAKSG